MSSVELTSRGVSVQSHRQIDGLSRSVFYREPIDWRGRDGVVIAAIQLMHKKLPKAG